MQNALVRHSDSATLTARFVQRGHKLRAPVERAHRVPFVVAELDADVE
jgi:hypothetical protein